MVGLEQLQTGHINVQIHLLLDVGIAGAQRLDFRIAQGGFVNVLRRAHWGFAGHDLPNELLLGFHQLIQVAVEGVLRDIGVNIDLLVFVALADDSSFPLLQVRRSPRTIQMMKCHKLRLHIGAGSHFLRGTDEHPHLTGAHLAKQLFLLRLGVCRMDIGDFLCRNALGNQLVSEIIVHIELAVAVGRRQVAEYHLCRFPIGGALPNVKDILSTRAHLTCLAVGEHIVHEPLVQGKLSAVIGDEEHVIYAGIHHLIADTLGSF